MPQPLEWVNGLTLVAGLTRKGVDMRLQETAGAKSNDHAADPDVRRDAMTGMNILLALNMLTRLHMC
ncbi:hypothetical protein [Stakelama pacifica]|uniref:hypothetical protein n=1 Tax=Stakelama pacifica TaxID=517720 RepID=UPI0013C3595B|nr:hypothetical protein [Stakelama pacifica]GGO93097.1 hypothetical protein GCM10011329_11700 [Stakelama pacifica]